MTKMRIAESVLNRVLNFIDDMEAPKIADPAALGQQLDAALGQPTPPVAPDANVVNGMVQGKSPLESLFAQNGDPVVGPADPETRRRLIEEQLRENAKGERIYQREAPPAQQQPPRRELRRGPAGETFMGSVEKMQRG